MLCFCSDDQNCAAGRETQPNAERCRQQLQHGANQAPEGNQADRLVRSFQ